MIIDFFKSKRRYSKSIMVSMIAVDVANLVSMFDIHKPEDIIQDIAECLRQINDLIISNGGKIEESAGGFMFFYFQEDGTCQHAEKACQAALGIHQCVIEFNKINCNKGIIGLKTAVGIHTGEVIITNELSGKGNVVKLLGKNINITMCVMKECDVEQNEILVSEETLRFVENKNVFIKKKDISIGLPNLNHNQKLALFIMRG